MKGDGKSRSKYVRSTFALLALLFVTFFLFNAFLTPSSRDNSSRWKMADNLQSLSSGSCKNKCRPPGSEVLPERIVEKTSNLQMSPLWGSSQEKSSSEKSLFAAAVGIKQKSLVNKTVTKFLRSNFVVMLFHYDGLVDEWKEFEWNSRVIHVSAQNQTKWWFAKRFMHPDVISAYEYIFLWDEDLGVENFDPTNYISIIKREGLEISQPALDLKSSDIHQQITARVESESVHRRTFKQGSCYKNSTAPPCTGWVEMMAPVFSQASWRCVWYMIQNDLIHAWGLDHKLGYCAQGNRMKKIGVVDDEYIVHYGRPTLGGGAIKAIKSFSRSRKLDPRLEVRRQSYKEFFVFKERWKNATAEDQCWVDPYN